jgi:hypothetical protein
VLTKEREITSGIFCFGKSLKINLKFIFTQCYLSNILKQQQQQQQTSIVRKHYIKIKIIALFV